MQSHLPKVLTICKRRAAAVGPRPGAPLSGVAVLACEQFVLLGPVQRQIEFGQPRRGERDGLPALQDRLDQLRAQEGETNETANVAPGNAVTLGQLLERSGAANRDLLKPRAPPRNRLDQGRITSRAVLLLRQSGQNQFGFGTAPREGGCRRQLDGAVTRGLRCG